MGTRAPTVNDVVAAVRERIIRGTYRDLFQTGDLALADRLVTPDFLDHAAPPQGWAAPGPESLKALVRFLHSALGDIRYDVQDLLSDGDRVAFRATMSAVQIGPIFGFPPSRRRFTMQQIHIVRFEGDLIAEHWACRDDLGALFQLGHLK